MEEALSNLEKRVEAVEKGRGYSQETEAALRAYQLQTVTKLKQVRDLLLSEDNINSSQIAKERDGLKLENEKLKKEIDKLNYRVKHLVRSVEQAEEGQRN